MKRLFPFIPIAFLFLLNSCAELPVSEPALQTAMAGTRIAETLTAAPTPTLNPNIPIMISRLNDDLSSINPLERTLDAEYSVIDVRFPNVPNRLELMFRIDVSCVCRNSDECCIPERTFVVITESVKRNISWLRVPENVSEMIVVCMDQKSRKQIGAVVAPWQDVISYLWGTGVGGYQLGAHAIRTVAP